MVNFEDSVKKSVADVRSDSVTTTWMNCKYADAKATTLTLAHEGSGDVQEFIDAFDDNEVMYGLCRVTDTIDDYVTIKFVFIELIGEKAPRMLRARIAPNRGTISDFFKPAHCEFKIDTVADITAAEVHEKVGIISGSKSLVVSNDLAKERNQEFSKKKEEREKVRITGESKLPSVPTTKLDEERPQKSSSQKEVTPASAPAAAATPASTLYKKEGPRILVSKLEKLQDPVIVNGEQLNECVIVENCKEIVVQVKGKISSISMINCEKVGICFEKLVATFEATRCKKCQIQVEETVPTFQIEKSDGISLYLSKACEENVEIVTSQTCSFNVVTQPATEDGDMVEHPVCEQFVSKFNDLSLETKPLENTY